MMNIIMLHEVFKDLIYKKNFQYSKLKKNKYLQNKLHIPDDYTEGFFMMEGFHDSIFITKGKKKAVIKHQS